MINDQKFEGPFLRLAIPAASLATLGARRMKAGKKAGIGIGMPILLVSPLNLFQPISRRSRAARS